MIKIFWTDMLNGDPFIWGRAGWDGEYIFKSYRFGPLLIRIRYTD